MLLRFISMLFFMLVLLPASIMRKLSQASRFGTKAYRAPSGWDQSMGTARAPKKRN